MNAKQGPGTAQPDESGDGSPNALLEEFVQNVIAWHRETFPAQAQTVSDEVLRERAIEAARRLRFDEFDNLVTGRALQATAMGRRELAAKWLHQYRAQQASVTTGQRASERGRVAAERLRAERQEAAALKRQRWQAMDEELRQKHPNQSERWRASRIAAKTSEKAGTIRAALRELRAHK